MSLGVEEDVLGFQVSIRDALCLMQELEDEGDFCSIELRSPLGEAPGSPEICEDFSARTVIELPGVSFLQTQMTLERASLQSCIENRDPGS